MAQPDRTHASAPDGSEHAVTVGNPVGRHLYLPTQCACVHASGRTLVLRTESVRRLTQPADARTAQRRRSRWWNNAARAAFDPEAPWTPPPGWAEADAR